MRLTADPFKVFEVAGFADEEAKVCALCCEGVCYVVAYESGGAC
jgi:hypothetical protein